MESRASVDDLVQQGGSLLRAHRVDEAVQMFTRALQQAPEHFQAREGLGMAHAMKGEIGQAITHLEAAVQHDHRPVTYYNLALLYHRQGNTPQAIQHLKTALRLNPEYTQARHALEHLEPPADIEAGSAAAGAAPEGPDIDQLLGRLQTGDRETRYAAAQILGELGDERAVAPLIQALDDDDDMLRRRAAEALGKIGDSRAIAPLIAALQQTNLVGVTAARALGQIGDPSAVGPLLAFLKEKSPLDEGHKYIIWAAQESLAGLGTGAVRPLLDELHDAHSPIRHLAAMILGEIGDVQAVEPLAAVLVDRKERRPPPAEPQVPPAMDKEAWERWTEKQMQWIRDEKEGPAMLRTSAAEALGKLGDARAVPALHSALLDPEDMVRDAADQALRQLHRAERQRAGGP